MKKWLALICAGLSCSLFGTAWAQAQDVPGFSMGGFYELRVENKVGGEDLSFGYYGVRLQVRGERMFEGFLDLGMQSLTFDPNNIDDTGAFGLGGTLWIVRQAGELPMDVGLFASYHVADYTIDLPGGAQTDAKHSRYAVQGVIRGGYGKVLPFLRAGILRTELDPDNTAVLTADGLEETKPAVNVGVNVELAEQLVLTVEGNYSESVGGGLHLDYWF